MLLMTQKGMRPHLSLGAEDGEGPRAQQLCPGAPGACGLLAGAVEAPVLGSQLSAAGVLPVTGGVSPWHKSGISSSPFSAPSPVK